MIWTKGSKVTSGPASEPITAATAKSWLKVEHTDDDTLITSEIASARMHIEDSTGLALFTQTITETLDAWPEADEVNNPYAAFHLLRYPVQSVTSITYYDGDGVQQTLSASNYIVDTNGTFCRIAPASGVSWPSLQKRINAVTVTFVAGWSSISDIPDNLKTALQLMVTYMYERRADGVKRYPTQAENLIGKKYVHVV